MTRLVSPRAAAAAAVCALVLASPGCGPPKVDVAGVVTHKQKPLGLGSVLVYVAGRPLPMYGTIGPDGRYAIPAVPAGTHRVAVYSPDPAEEAAMQAQVQAAAAGKDDARPRPLGAAARPPGWVPIPEQYGDPLRSDLTLDVSPGRTAYDLTLE